MSNRTVLVVAALTLITGVLFVSASAIEKQRRHGTEAAQVTQGGEHREAEEGEGQAGKEASDSAHGTQEGRFMGVDLEAPWVTYAVVIETLVLILALLILRQRGPVLYVVIVLAIIGTMLDVREAVHQAGAASWLLAFMAVAVAASRIGAAAVSLVALVRGGGRA